ncbi:hypothetical protein DKE52_004620 [Acinetobacter pittii]|uniref:Uncharacterized protein n=1 Tax=Acinetobacter pittii TaxID=48296 RepID=A0A3G6YIX5_ACIPI|nr:hypothetical protein DKE52_004620 [Acinetobacter pittii]
MNRIFHFMLFTIFRYSKLAKEFIKKYYLKEDLCNFFLFRLFQKIKLICSNAHQKKLKIFFKMILLTWLTY